MCIHVLVLASRIDIHIYGHGRMCREMCLQLEQSKHTRTHNGILAAVAATNNNAAVTTTNTTVLLLLLLLLLLLPPTNELTNAAASPPPVPASQAPLHLR